jgi:hypothetical protein
MGFWVEQAEGEMRELCGLGGRGGGGDK